MKWLARQKLRYDYGTSFMSVLTFLMALIAASDTLVEWLPSVSKRALLTILLPAAIAGVWMMGYVLDKLRFTDAYQDELNKRNAKLMEALKINEQQ